MAELVYVPIYVIVVSSLLLGTLTQLEALADQTTSKTIDYTTDMTNALDCAYTARPLNECSPNLLNEDYAKEIEETQRILRDLQDINKLPN